ncbi:MAG: RNA polymerase sporulation sigma factor SigH, partial [Thermoleophilia bacterium]|nr:RNA polymerase sporulation sigma factor SigH [Thermoleophilia bacterium]
MESAAYARKTADKAAVEPSDEELVAGAKAGDPDAFRRIWTRYRQFVRMKANSYFLAGGDGDDLIQEGNIGLYKAIRDYE